MKGTGHYRIQPQVTKTNEIIFVITYKGIIGNKKKSILFLFRFFLNFMHHFA